MEPSLSHIFFSLASMQFPENCIATRNGIACAKGKLWDFMKLLLSFVLKGTIGPLSSRHNIQKREYDKRFSTSGFFMD
jgi:hypothetical protein